MEVATRSAVCACRGTLHANAWKLERRMPRQCPSSSWPWVLRAAFPGHDISKLTGERSYDPSSRARSTFQITNQQPTAKWAFGVGHPYHGKWNMFHIRLLYFSRSFPPWQDLLYFVENKDAGELAGGDAHEIARSTFHSVSFWWWVTFWW